MMSSDKVSGITGASKVEKTDDKMSAAMLKRSDSKQDTGQLPEVSKKSTSVATKSGAELTLDRDKIETGSVSSTKTQKFLNFFTNIGRVFEGKPALPWKIWDSHEDKNFTKTFGETLNKALGDNIWGISKKEFKMISDSMSGGKTALNYALIKVGFENPEKLGKILESGGSVSITPIQKQALKDILNGTEPKPKERTVLTEKSTQTIKNIMEKVFTPPDRSDISTRYTNKDFILSPEMSGLFKEKTIKEFSGENFDFLQDLKIAIKNPDKESLKTLIDKYVKNDSEFAINASSSTKIKADKISDSSSVEDMLAVLQPAAVEINRLMSDTVGRLFSDTSTTIKPSGYTGISEAIHADAMLLPPGKGLEYIQSLIDRGNAPDASTHEKSVSKSAKGALIISQKIIEENLKVSGII